MAKFKTRQGAIIDDIKTYVANWIAEGPNAKIFIGCDSQEHERNIDYAVSICIYDPGKGGHVIDRKTTHPLTKTNQHRLWEEVNNHWKWLKNSKYWVEKSQSTLIITLCWRLPVETWISEIQSVFLMNR